MEQKAFELPLSKMRLALLNDVSQRPCVSLRYQEYLIMFTFDRIDVGAQVAVLKMKSSKLLEATDEMVNRRMYGLARSARGVFIL